MMVLTAHNGRCVYCGAESEVMDHVIPLAGGGMHSTQNLVPACDDCNQSKSDAPSHNGSCVGSFRRSPTGGELRSERYGFWRATRTHTRSVSGPFGALKPSAKSWPLRNAADGLSNPSRVSAPPTIESKFVICGCHTPISSEKLTVETSPRIQSVGLDHRVTSMTSWMPSLANLAHQAPHFDWQTWSKAGTPGGSFLNEFRYYPHGDKQLSNVSDIWQLPFRDRGTEE
ncbi:HNH endonuclease [Streptomyces actinomycinicus]